MKLFRSTLVALAAVLVAGAALPGVRSALINRHPYYHLGDLARYNRMVARGYGEGAKLRRGPNLIDFTAKQRRMTLNGVKITQSFAPVIGRGGFFISRTDWEETIRPMLFPETIRKHMTNTVWIDCGHGGVDKGASGRYSHEKIITMRLGKRVADILKASGFQVRFTRFGDITMTLAQRTAATKRGNGDIFVSIHANSATDSTISGIETFCATQPGSPSGNDSKVKYNRYDANAFNGNNIYLAYSIQKALLSRTKAVDRGVKRARFVVVRDVAMPAVLIEVGFLSNRGDEKRLNTPAYREQIARGIVEGIIAYKLQTSPPSAAKAKAPGASRKKIVPMKQRQRR